MQIRERYSCTYWFGQHGFWMMQNSGNPGLGFSAWKTFHFLSLDSIILVHFHQNCMCHNLHDNWNWAGRKDTEIHGAAIRITTAVDVTLCWSQVTDTQSSNYRNKRGGMQNFANSREWLPPALQRTKSPFHTKGPFYFSYCTFGAICEVKISQFECFSIKGFPKVALDSLGKFCLCSLGKFCLCPTYKDSDLVSYETQAFVFFKNYPGDADN